MNVKACSVQGIYSTESVLEHDPEVERFKGLLADRKPRKPYAFVFGHGLWNDLDLQATLNWLDGINKHALNKAPYLESTSWPRLMITPNAAGIKKLDQWIVSQGDKALLIFEHGVRTEVAKRGVEHLGTWNMSIQTHKYDGVHMDLKGNLVKAMAVVNWLAGLDLERW
jgi:hypothetical protein